MKFLRNNGLSLVLGALFLLFWGCQTGSGWHVFNDDQLQHARHAGAFSTYLASGHFWHANAESRENEFLQMGPYVVLACFLYQKGSADSKNPYGKTGK